MIEKLMNVFSLSQRRSFSMANQPESIPNPQPLPPSSSTPTSTVPLEVDEVKKSPFRFLIPVLGVVLILGIGGFLFYRYLNRGSSSSEPMEIVYWGLWEPQPVLQAIFTEFESQNPGIKVNYQQQKITDYRERLATAIESGQGPDLFRYHHSWLPMIGPLLSPVPASVFTDSSYQATFYPIAAQWLKGSRAYLGIPLEIDGLGLYYNQTIFTAAGKQPPDNWEALRVTAKQLTVYSGDTIQRGGVALGTTNNVEHWSDILGAMLLQNGANPEKPNNPNGQDAVTFYTLFTTTDRVWDATMPPAVYAFATEKVTMMIAPSWRAFDLRDQNPNLKFAIAPLPQLPGTNTNWASFWVEGVSNKTSNDKQEAAWKLLQFLSQKETLQKLYTAQSQVRLFGEPFSRIDMADQLTSDPYVGAYIKTAPSAQSWYLNSFTFDNGVNDQIIKYYEDAVNAVTSGTPALKALVTTEEGINQVMKKYNVQ